MIMMKVLLILVIESLRCDVLMIMTMITTLVPSIAIPAAVLGVAAVPLSTSRI